MRVHRALSMLRRLGGPGLVVLAAACGGGGGTAPRADEPPPLASEQEPTGPGRLESATALNRIARADIEAADSEPGSRTPPLVPLYDVANHRLEYRTTDAQGREIVASGLVSVPVKAAGAPSPLLSYQHGTIFHDARAPSNHATADEAAVILASLGYIVIAADYVGYGASKGAPHPYLLAAPSAAATVDLLTAARTWRRRTGTADNGQLFLAGYSEGGYATVAAHRALQASRSVHLTGLLAVAPGAGPYDVRVTLDALLQRVRDEVPELAALIDPLLLALLDDSVRQRLRVELFKRLLPPDADVVFDPTAIDRYLAGNLLALELHSNVHDWAPDAPVRLFHGRDDQTVPFLSSERALRVMRERGGRDVSLVECSAVPSGHIACVPEFVSYLLSQFAPLVRDL
jgi:alpha-beta hydrolase superfamily lysophospholipase